MQEFLKFCLRDRQRIFLLPGVRDKVIASREYLSDRAYLCGDMYDAVEDHVVLIAEDDVAVFSHELDHDEFSPEIAHLIEMLDLDPDDPLQSRLGHGDDPAVCDMLS